MTSQETALPATHGWDTIAAFATAVGGPIAVIRISGGEALQIAEEVWTGKAPLAAPPYHQLRLGRIAGPSGEVDEQALAVHMPAPRSYTGEHMIELHAHGGALAPRMALLRVLEAGARHAEPGEFTKRAFLNGKLDLTQAEAVSDLIGAHTEAALRVANRQLAGALGNRLRGMHDEATFILGEMEVRLDFPEEDLDWLSADAVTERVGALRQAAERLLESETEGHVLREGVHLVIAGPTNVGKSSLLNAILGRDRAIVTNIPGTTRDTVEDLAHVRGIPIHLADTAGIREATDPAEREGVARSQALVQQAEVVLWVVDVSTPYAGQEWQGRHDDPRLVVVGNKSDRMTSEPTDFPPDLPAPVYTCALTGCGLEDLFDAVEGIAWGRPHQRESVVAVSARHAHLLNQALSDLAGIDEHISAEEWEVAAVGLRGAITALGRIIGRTADPDLLADIFSRFCIGK